MSTRTVETWRFEWTWKGKKKTKSYPTLDGAVEHMRESAETEHPDLTDRMITGPHRREVPA